MHGRDSTCHSRGVHRYFGVAWQNFRNGERAVGQMIIPPAHGRALRVASGETLRITTPKGAQAADFFAFTSATVGEWLSPNHSWVFTRHVRPRKGDVFLSRFRRP